MRQDQLSALFSFHLHHAVKLTPLQKAESQLSLSPSTKIRVRVTFT